MGQTTKLRDDNRDVAGTVPLETLARRVLARLGERDRSGTVLAQAVPELSAPMGQEQHAPVPGGREIDSVLAEAALEWVVQFEERAAICEYDGKLTREAAEDIARAELLARSATGLND